MNTLLFINSLIGEDVGTTKAKGILIATVWIFVAIGMIIDLVSGLRKAKLAGIDSTSELARRTTAKVVKNYGALTFTFMFDVIIMYVGNLYHNQIIENVPIATMLMGCFIMWVEYLSFRENLDQKQRNKDDVALKDLASIISALRELKGGDKKLEDLLPSIRENKKKDSIAIHGTNSGIVGNSGTVGNIGCNNINTEKDATNK